MADKSINDLPVSPGLDDDALLPVWQNNQTQSIKGQQVRLFAQAALGDSVERAEEAAQTAEESAASIGDSVAQAAASASAAQAAQAAVEAVEVSAETLEAGQDASVEKSIVEGALHLLFGLPRGIQGPKGDPGNNIESITRTSGTGAPGTTDTYTVTLTDGSSTTFQVYNGADGTGAGDMTTAVYDPAGKATDIFAYADAAAEGVDVGVTTFNGRTGAVAPQNGDYTAAMVGAATMQEVNAAIQEAILDSWEASY